MTSNVTVITATTPTRGFLLADAIASVAQQTEPVFEHLVSVDLHKGGGAATKNSLISRTRTSWIQILDDDDILMPHHIETLMPHAVDGVDVVYSYAHGENYSGWYNVPFNPKALFENNNISHNAIIRKSLFEKIGPFGPEYGYDWTFWARAIASGATFVCVPEVTWEYRLSPNWLHESHENAGYPETKRMVAGYAADYYDRDAEKEFTKPIKATDLAAIIARQMRAK